ncbi:MAG: hypothetical protein BWK78_08985 [Thiotrichaceae bacterium IS1]|nr:MAG: hypothetical protein BWK78_08985 [Thiotrichaceae bacterium IS1]
MAKNNSPNNSRFVFPFQFRLMPIIREHLVTYKDGYYWFILTCTFALLVPAIMKLIIPCFEYNYWEFFSQGDIALFSMVIVTSLVVDNFFFEKDFQATLEKKGYTEFGKGFSLFIFPVLAILFCLGVYLRCQAMKGEIGIPTVLLEMLIFLGVAIYAAFVKHTSWEGKDSSIFSPRKSLIITTS